MKILLCSGVKLIKKDDEYYTSSDTHYDYLNRFKIHDSDEIIFVCREIESNGSTKDLAKASGKGVKIIGIGSLRYLAKRGNREQLKKIIFSAELRIVKMPSFIGSYVCHVLKKKNEKFVIDLVGCPWDAFWNHSFCGKIVAPFMFGLTRYFVKKADAVIYVTNAFLQRRYPTDAIILGCSDVILKQPEEAVLNNRITRIRGLESTKKITIGTIGAVDVRYKGQKYVIESMRKLKEAGYDVEYQLVGNGSPDRLKRIAQKNGVEDEVRFLGSMPHDEIFIWLDGIDLYVQPSEVEGLCRSVIEAMSRACPVIVSNAGGNPELVDGKYVFDNRNSRQLFDKITSLTKDKMIKMARDNFNNSMRFNEQELGKKRKNFLRSLLGSK
ncbi:glycosyltransferase family 4 protein [Candidatus Saccharibacteria bacterium]|nr:glycosyltransferase family 4 protein [Candidatus Saccharibacteria bacterium]